MGVIRKTIYVLVDPRNGRIRYVGATQSTLARRKATHRAMAHKLASPVSVWVSQLRALGLSPEIKAISAPTADWQQAEKDAIAVHRKRFPDLLNLAAGGLGCFGVVPKEASRQKRSASLRARYDGDPAQMAQRQELARQAARSPAGREAASKRMNAIWSNPDRAEAMRQRMRGAKQRKREACCT